MSEHFTETMGRIRHLSVGAGNSNPSGYDKWLEYLEVSDFANGCGDSTALRELMAAQMQ